MSWVIILKEGKIDSGHVFSCYIRNWFLRGGMTLEKENKLKEDVIKSESSKSEKVIKSEKNTNPKKKSNIATYAVVMIICVIIIILIIIWLAI